MKVRVRPRVLFLGSGYAGHRTRFDNLREHTRNDLRIAPSYRLVSGWQEGGMVERLPLVSQGIRGRIRALTESATFLKLPRPDVIWTSALTAIRPWILGHLGPMRRPLVLDDDCAIEVRDVWAQVYWNRPPHRGVRRWLLAQLDQRVSDQATFWTPWSEWAGDSLRQSGVSDDRIFVLPPGVDLDEWRPPAVGRKLPEGPIRLLFVGGNFARKGGYTLCDVIRSLPEQRFLVDIVTREAVPETPHVKVHRAEANSPLLRHLYERADAFVLPSQAECFGIATIEAMASGLPVVVGNTGAGPEIVGDEAGWAIPPTHDALASALNALWDCREQLPAIGARGRKRAERKFDGRANDERVVNVILDAFHRRRPVGG